VKCTNVKLFQYLKNIDESIEETLVKYTKKIIKRRKSDQVFKKKDLSEKLLTKLNKQTFDLNHVNCDLN